jgi:hypothetical protein
MGRDIMARQLEHLLEAQKVASGDYWIKRDSPDLN